MKSLDTTINKVAEKIANKILLKEKAAWKKYCCLLYC
jgi:hypothetical protein